jgi:putative ABC transport system permease protein
MNLAFRLARREMRSGLGGFRLLIACLALGVGAIAAILSFSRAVEEGVRADSREILGGDVSISVLYRQATPDQEAFLAQQGKLTRWIDSRSMAHPVKEGGKATLVQLKAVEGAYPLSMGRSSCRAAALSPMRWPSATACGARSSRKPRSSAWISRSAIW